VQTPSSERPVPPKLPRARAAAWIESVADAAAAASVTPNRAISGADTEQRAACAAQGSESESSSVDRKCCRRSCGGERHTRHGDQRCTCRAARGLKLPRARAAALIESVADASAAASVTPNRAISGAHSEQRVACRPSFREREKQLDRERSRCSFSAVSVTPDRAISGAHAEQRVTPATESGERDRCATARPRRTSAPTVGIGGARHLS
jgi:hypothetical protein